MRGLGGVDEGRERWSVNSEPQGGGLLEDPCRRSPASSPGCSLKKKSEPELPERPPMWMGNRSNGEYYHPATREEKLIHRMVMERADSQARRLGMERREFLASSMGMFTTLAVINQVAAAAVTTATAR